ncbi:MAG: hypothetical protein Q4E61_04615 [Alphaproteobacteria bacterium]|nr:hypothetical protein [Alphaproteobacteria bacterium]
MKGHSIINKDICASCRGKCCKATGCGLMPCDIVDKTPAGIQRLLDSGRYSISFFLDFIDMKLEVIPTMMSREINSSRIQFGFIHNQCSLLGPKGCSLSDDERPTQGLLFVPQMEANCELQLNSQTVVTEWRKLSPLMETVLIIETGSNSLNLFQQSLLQTMNHLETKLSEGIILNSSELSALELVMRVLPFI